MAEAETPAMNIEWFVRQALPWGTSCVGFHVVRVLQGATAAIAMRTTRIPPQIVRLAILTILIVAAYFTARHFLVPASFGEYGWYRGDYLKEARALPTTFAGAAACSDCHTEVVEKKAQGGHKFISCESCHGALGSHVEDPTATPPKIKDHSFCVRCHEANPSRPETFPQVDVADHAGNQNCMECHQPHQPKESP